MKNLKYQLVIFEKTDTKMETVFILLKGRYSAIDEPMDMRVSVF